MAFGLTIESIFPRLSDLRLTRKIFEKILIFFKFSYLLYLPFKLRFQVSKCME